MIPYLLPLSFLLGYLLDLLFGDPAWLPHPVVGFGKWISCWEHRLNKGRCRKLKGAIFALTSIALTFSLTWLLNYTLFNSHFFARACSIDPSNARPWSLHTWRTFNFQLLTFNSIIVFFCLAGHTLRCEVRDVFLALDRSLDEGRRQVARIVGRDTANLSAQEVRTAALETLAENLSDGVIAPLFWFAILGAPGMLTYKMINTLDSMIGYRNERYLDFGCWAARIDDIANYIPARLTALLMILPHAIIHRTLYIVHFVRKYGRCHASPNSGYPEAALAGILDCRFGGTHDYFGEAVVKPYIGDNPRPLTTTDLHTSLRVCITAELLAITLVLLRFLLPTF